MGGGPLGLAGGNALMEIRGISHSLLVRLLGYDTGRRIRGLFACLLRCRSCRKPRSSSEAAASFDGITTADIAESVMVGAHVRYYAWLEVCSTSASGVRALPSEWCVYSVMQRSPSVARCTEHGVSDV